MDHVSLEHDDVARYQRQARFDPIFEHHEEGVGLEAEREQAAADGVRLACRL